MPFELDVQLYKAFKATSKDSSSRTMAETYGLAYRLYVFLWFQLTAILETIGNSFNAVGLYRRRRAKLPDSLAGQTVLITGANSGIGKETAKAAAARGAVVLLACRDLKKAEQAVAEILEDVGKDKADNLQLFELDLSSLASVRACAAAISERFSVIDVLINNAGLMMCPQWSTVDGFEVQLATNHLGHFLLTLLLLDRLRASPIGARIVNLSSVAHMPGQLYLDNLNMTGDLYTPFKAYARSKMANVLFTRELARRLNKAAGNKISVYACHPGMVNTELKRHLGGLQQCLLAAFNRLVLISPELGAQTSLYCAFDERVKNQSGFYYDNCSRVTKLPAHVLDDENAARLWEVSLKMCNMENNNFVD